jgi:hypothetical protein
MPGLRLLLVVLLLLNAMGGESAFAASDMDCCGGVSCECECAAPQVAALPVSQPRSVWPAAVPGFAFEVKAFRTSPRNAPFRPPA